VANKVLIEVHGSSVILKMLQMVRCGQVRSGVVRCGPVRLIVRPLQPVLSTPKCKKICWSPGSDLYPTRGAYSTFRLQSGLHPAQTSQLVGRGLADPFQEPHLCSLPSGINPWGTFAHRGAMHCSPPQIFWPITATVSHAYSWHKKTPASQCSSEAVEQYGST